MPRIKKQGLDYFPINTDFIHDRLVRRIMKREGDASLSVLIEVLCYIYAGEGYYVQADSLFYEDLSSNLYEKSCEDVKRIVALAVEYGVFDAGLFSQFGILTSTDIQRQYIFSTKRRNVSQLNTAYCLISEEQRKEEVESVKLVKKTKGDSPCNADEKAAGSTLRANVNRAKDVTIIPENVTSGTHSIAQNSIAQHSVAENSINSPSPASPEAGKEELSKQGGGKEEEISFGTNRVMENRVTESEVVESEVDKSTTKKPVKRHEWTNAAIDELRPPTDGVDRNYNGLVYNLRLYSIPPSEQYAIIRKSNFGVIGDPVWKGFCTLRDSAGKIKLPGRYLLSVMNR